MKQEGHGSATELESLRRRLSAAVIGAYEIGGIVGAGAAGAVFEARDRRHDRRVAIKVIREELADSAIAARFLREIRIIAGLQHPHILPLFDSGEADGLLYYVSPLIVGESLRQRVAREKQLPLLEVCHIVRQAAGALNHAHRMGIVHRDVKPDNILLAEGEAFVADFGIAKAALLSGDGSATSIGVAVGTPLYMSPEQVTAESDIDGRTDQYALACVAYEMLTGEPPFRGPNTRSIFARHMTASPPDARLLRPSVSGEAAAVLQRALGKTPGDRYSTILEFADMLETTLAGRHRSTPALSTPSRPTARAGRLVSKTCNRWAQVNAFDSFLRRSRRANPDWPQLYVMHGEEGDAHDSLLERLILTTLSRFAEEIGGLERGVVARVRTPWPDADDLESAQRDLAIALLREADPSYLGDDLSAQALARALATRPQRVVVIHHDIRVAHCRRFTPSLVQWYANEFWGTVDTRRLDQQIIVFIKMIYSSRRDRSPLSLVRRAFEPDPRRMQQEIETRLRASDFRCACMVFKELQPVTVDDVKEWLSSNAIYDSEQRRLELAESLFRDRPRKRMSEVEMALETIHRTFMSEQQFEFGSGT
jgi:serine/threonine protein kinase